MSTTSLSSCSSVPFSLSSACSGWCHHFVFFSLRAKKKTFQICCPFFSGRIKVLQVEETLWAVFKRKCTHMKKKHNSTTPPLHQIFVTNIKCLLSLTILSSFFFFCLEESQSQVSTSFCLPSRSIFLWCSDTFLNDTWKLRALHRKPKASANMEGVWGDLLVHTCRPL